MVKLIRIAQNNTTPGNCMGCARHCWIGCTSDMPSGTFRPSIGITTVYSITNGDNTTFPVYSNSKLAIRRAYKLAATCKHNHNKYTR